MSDQVRSPYIDGLYASVLEEMTVENLPVVGEIPSDLNGLFLQNGPNPRFSPGPGHSWFDGDGMIHAVRLDQGKATFYSRWIETQGLREDLAAGGATYVGSLAKPCRGKRHKNVANTDIVFHAGRLLALWWEGGEPYELGFPDIKTRGPLRHPGLAIEGLTSHAKIDPKTGELCFFSWHRTPPYLRVGTVSALGRVVRYTAVELPGPRIQHDFAISDRFFCVFDFALRLDLDRPGDRLGFSFDADSPARLGLVDRRDGSAPVRWFEVAPCFLWHISSAWDEGDEFVLVAARIEHPTRIDRTNKIRTHGPMVDGEHRFDARAYVWRLNLATGAVREQQLDERWVEFPRVNDAHICSNARYSYMIELDPDEPTVKGRGILRYDLATRQVASLRFPDRHVGYEVSFAPRTGSRDEDDGYLVGFVTDERQLTTALWITPSRTLCDGPVARIALPQKVPPKFHGRWIPAERLPAH